MRSNSILLTIASLFIAFPAIADLCDSEPGVPLSTFKITATNGQTKIGTFNYCSLDDRLVQVSFNFIEKSFGRPSSALRFKVDEISVSDSQAVFKNQTAHTELILGQKINLYRNEKLEFSGSVEFAPLQPVADVRHLLIQSRECTGFMVETNGQNEIQDYAVSATHCPSSDFSEALIDRYPLPPFLKFFPKNIQAYFLAVRISNDKKNAQYLSLKFLENECEDTKVAKVDRTLFPNTRRFHLSPRFPKIGERVIVRGFQDSWMPRALECINLGVEESLPSNMSVPSLSPTFLYHVLDCRYDFRPQYQDFAVMGQLVGGMSGGIATIVDKDKAEEVVIGLLSFGSPCLNSDPKESSCQIRLHVANLNYLNYRPSLGLLPSAGLNLEPVYNGYGQVVVPASSAAGGAPIKLIYDTKTGCAIDKRQN